MGQLDIYPKLAVNVIKQTLIKKLKIELCQSWIEPPSLPRAQTSILLKERATMLTENKNLQPILKEKLWDVVFRK